MAQGSPSPPLFSKLKLLCCPEALRVLAFGNRQGPPEGCGVSLRLWPYPGAQFTLTLPRSWIVRRCWKLPWGRRKGFAGLLKLPTPLARCPTGSCPPNPQQKILQGRIGGAMERTSLLVSTSVHEHRKFTLASHSSTSPVRSIPNGSTSLHLYASFAGLRGLVWNSLSPPLTGVSFPSFRSLLKGHLFGEVFPDHPRGVPPWSLSYMPVGLFLALSEITFGAFVYQSLYLKSSLIPVITYSTPSCKVTGVGWGTRIPFMRMLSGAKVRALPSF